MKAHSAVTFTFVLTLISSTYSIAKPALSLTSVDVHSGESLKSQQVFNSWGCSGLNQSPQLAWENIPAGTKSFAVTMYDPDAPTGSGWWHWVMINVPVSVTQLETNAGAEGGKLMPTGAQMQRNDFGYIGFGGACPPEGAKPHQYEITLYALDIEKLDVPKEGSPALAGYYILQHTLDTAKIVAPTNTRK